MTVISHREVLPRTFQHRFGDSPSAERKYVVTVDEPTATQTVIDAVGITHGAPHPEFAYLKMTDASVNETDRHHVEITYKYDLLKREYEPNPLLRPDVWSFSTGGVAIPTFMYFNEDDGLQPLVNAAHEIIEGAMTDESEVRATISGNRATFPLAIAAYVTNAVNDSEYLGCVQHTWKCAGISGQQATEVVNGAEVRYYQISAELVYRASGWALLLPDVGFNFLENGERKRCYTLVDGEQVATVNPVALAADGRMMQPGNPPRILNRRVHRAVPFSTYFGEPTF